ncbi:MAG TPA: phosphate ABC transporter substrate-binding protein [Burkholderiales bacterium]|nr:phosphate ABC transporter substrate-binding protein [Burkholderiales bacterium]
MTAVREVSLHALLGDYPVTRMVKSGAIRSPLLTFDFVDTKNVVSCFKRVVRDLEFDVAELALTTYLLAKAHGKPLGLLPIVLFSRYQHPYLVYNSDRGVMTPQGLQGKRVAIRSYSVTTSTWIRGMLQADYGVDLSSIRWLTFEEPHVAEFRDPPNVERAPADKTLMGMLLDGEVDAAVVGDIANLDPRLKAVIPDTRAAAQSWRERHGALQINHMVVVSEKLSRARPEVVSEAYRLLSASRRAAPATGPEGWDPSPCGVEANRRNLEVAIDCVYSQGMIPRRYAVDELFDEATRDLN